jgi:hypothetical protein
VGSSPGYHKYPRKVAGAYARQVAGARLGHHKYASKVAGALAQGALRCVPLRLSHDGGQDSLGRIAGSFIGKVKFKRAG